MNFLYAKAYKKPRGWKWLIHDCVIVIMTILLQIFGLYYTIKVQIIEGEDHEILF